LKKYGAIMRQGDLDLEVRDHLVVSDESRFAACHSIALRAPLRDGFPPIKRAVADARVQTLLREQLIDLRVFLHASNYWQYIVRSDRRRKGLAHPSDVDWDEDDAKRDADEGPFFPSPTVAAAAATAVAAVV
jgi:hypothetical protein